VCNFLFVFIHTTRIFAPVGDDENSDSTFSNDIDLVNSAVNLVTSNLGKCAYHHNFNVTKGKLSINRSTLSIIHVNIRSLQKNFDALYEFLCAQPSSPDIICITETRLKTTPLLNIDISGYSFVHNDSTTNAGGVAMYISNALPYSLLSNVHMDIDECENIWIKLLGSNLTIATIYRHPKNDLLSFMDVLNKNLEKFKNSKVFLVGDFNNRTVVSNASTYIDMLLSNGFYPLINIPTRVTENSSTIIDHIITNDHSHDILRLIQRIFVIT